MNKSRTEGPTKAELRKARSEFRKALASMMTDAKKHALASLDKAENDSAHVLRDHIADGSRFRIPKQFLCAVLLELASSRGYGPSSYPGKDRRAEAQIKRYRLFI